MTPEEFKAALEAEPGRIQVMPAMPTLRDQFAMAALAVAEADSVSSVAEGAAILGIDPKDYSPDIHYPKLVARRAYQYADAMLEARKP